jgi:hypothetical protein
MGPSGPGVLGRLISEKKQKKIETSRAARDFWAKNQIGPPKENKNCFRFSDSREWDSNQKI